MFDIITFGSAIRDTFIKLEKEDHYIIKDPKLIGKRAFHFPLGAKIEVGKIYVFSGGGGTNTAATFANQGFKVAYVGKLGKDKRGEAILEELKKLGIETQFVKKDKKYPTAYSLIISSPAGERTIFVYRGASHYLTKKEIPWEKLRAKWFYLATLSGKTAQIFADIVDFAKKNQIKIVCNPGNIQINLGLRILKPILRKVDILILNQEEASLLTKTPYQAEMAIFRKLNKLCPGIVIVTKGKEGVVLSDKKFFYFTPALKVKILEKTGAGDAFSAGFLAEYIKTKDIQRSLQFAIANASSCIKKIGAKNGLLKKGEKYQRVKIKRIKIK